MKVDLKYVRKTQWSIGRQLVGGAGAGTTGCDLEVAALARVRAKGLQRGRGDAAISLATCRPPENPSHAPGRHPGQDLGKQLFPSKIKSALKSHVENHTLKTQT